MSASLSPRQVENSVRRLRLRRMRQGPQHLPFGDDPLNQDNEACGGGLSLCTRSIRACRRICRTVSLHSRVPTYLPRTLLCVRLSSSSADDVVSCGGTCCSRCVRNFRI